MFKVIEKERYYRVREDLHEINEIEKLGGDFLFPKKGFINGEKATPVLLCTQCGCIYEFIIGHTSCPCCEGNDFWESTGKRLPIFDYGKPPMRFFKRILTGSIFEVPVGHLKHKINDISFITIMSNNYDEIHLELTESTTLSNTFVDQEGTLWRKVCDIPLLKVYQQI